MATIGIDFDGTIVTHEYPSIGQEVPGALATIKALKDNGHRLFLWTIRDYKNYRNRTLEEAKEWLEARGIDMDGYNRSPISYGSNSPKPAADWFIDDRNVCTPTFSYKKHNVPAWDSIACNLHTHNLITIEQYKNILDIIATWSQD